MTFDLQPYQSLGPLPFLQKRALIRPLLNDEFQTHALTEGRLPIDEYSEAGLQLIYDKYDRFSAAEIESPSQVIFQDKDLMALPWNESLTWFQQLDDNIEESEKDFISWKYGIAIFAPEKNENPTVLPTSVTVFHKKHFYVKDGIPDPTEINSFHLHVAFVEGVADQKGQNFDNLPEALRAVFAQTREYGILLWSGIPLRFSYAQDLPQLILPLLELLENINKNAQGQCLVQWDCPSFAAEWQVEWNQKHLKINSDWQHATAGLEVALNSSTEDINTPLLLKKEFLAEWKIILQQINDGCRIAGIKPPDLHRVQQLQKTIPELGKFYKNGEKVISQTADHRKTVDLRKLPNWIQYIVIASILSFVLIPVYLLSKDKDSPFWALQQLPYWLLYMSPFLLIVGGWIYFKLKRK